MSMTERAARLALPTWLIACVVLGGASAAGLLANLLLQLIATVIVTRELWSARPALPVAARPPLWIAAATAILLLATLLPLPPALWGSFPGRAEIAGEFALIGTPGPKLATSLAPEGTIGATLALLPPLATYLLALRATPEARRLGAIAMGGIAILSVLLGVLQQVSGYRSDLYIYEVTSRGGAVGFFANRNHLATLCLMTMPMLAALATSLDRSASRSAVGQFLLAGVALLFLMLGTLLVQSLAGWLLIVPTLLGCLLVYRGRRGLRRQRLLAPAAGAVLAIALLAALFAPLSPTDLDRTFGEVRPQQRQTIMRTTLRAAGDYLPIGSGFGSFTRVYPPYEDPARITTTYVNHAHNDYLELLLEGGLPGLALLAAFLAWWAARVGFVWRMGAPAGPLARGATVAVAAALAHSAVDYPLRTAAIACLAAFACALLAAPEPGTTAAPRRARDEDRQIALGRDDRARIAR